MGHLLASEGTDRSVKPRLDEVIPAADISEATQPLYSKPVDRREWTVGESVDYRVTASDAPMSVWIKAIVHAVDPVSDRVKVCYLTKDRDQALEKFGVVSDSPITTATITNTPSVEHTVWCDILDDNICPMFTHTKKIVILGYNVWFPSAQVNETPCTRTSLEKKVNMHIPLY